MLKLLQKGLVCQAAIAESLTGVTRSIALSGELKALQKEYLANQHTLNSTRVADTNDNKVVQGPKVKSVAVGILPVDGSQPTVAQVAFHALLQLPDHRIPQLGHDLVPDFYDAWGQYQLHRRYWIVNLRAQESGELNGDYRLYWNESLELSENKSIKGYLGEETIEAARRFWYGDVFLAHFTEHPETFAYNVCDVPRNVTQCEALRNLFQQMWADQFLESELEGDRYLAEEQAKRDSDEEIILSRMTPEQLEVLDRMPAGYLGYLALTACDDGAMGDFSVETDPDDPTMVRIDTMMQQTALDLMGWTGFEAYDV